MEWLKTRRNDAILIAVLLILGGALALFLYATRQDGGCVLVSMNGGEELLKFSLDENVRIVLGEGEHTNTLVIENRRVRVAEATCPDQVCVRQGAVRYEGESIVCLPNKLVITVKGGQPNDVDATAK